MSETKVLRVVGLSASIPIDKSDPFSPTNRRISIIVMNQKTEDSILKEGTTEIGGENSANRQLSEQSSGD
jgi:chemotaxis protein MotB